MNIAVWYHCKLAGPGIPQPDTAEKIVIEQLQALNKSGLEDAADEIHFCFNGPGVPPSVCLWLPLKSFIHWNGNDASTELPTLAILRRWLPTHRGWAVFYHHSKGVTQPNDAFHHHHRRTMQNYLVKEWRRCVADLERGYETVGINAVHPVKRPVLPGKFYAGNFWWATSDYLLTLPPIKEWPATWADRLIAEGWVLSARREPRMTDYERPELYQ